VLHALGEDDAAVGNYEAAFVKLIEARKATAQVLKNKPGNADAIFAHGQSEFWIGSTAFYSNDQPRALQQWRSYFDLARALDRVEPRTARSLLELGYAHGNLCDVNMRDQRDVAAGIQHCGMALEFERAALAKKPGDEEVLRALANRHGWFSDALLGEKKYAEARAHREAEAAIMASLLKANSHDAELRDRAIWPQIGLAKIDIAERKLAQGFSRFRACLRDLDGLAMEFPDNQLVLGERIRVNVLLAAALRRAGRAEWIVSRDRAELLLYGTAALQRKKRIPKPGLQRQHDMFEKLEKGERR
jgi:serine/threonine-protein kinase